MKRNLMLVLSIIMLIVTLITTILAAFLLDKIIKDGNVVVGNIDINHHIYFTKGETVKDAEEILIDTTTNQKKKGIYFVNLDNDTAIEFIKNLNVDLYVDSDVDTYIRVKVIEQITLIVENFLGEKTEVSIISEPTVFKLATGQESTWYFDDISGFYYYKIPVKQLEEPDENNATAKLVKFIVPLDNYSPMPPNYSMQVGFIIEAVQTKGGPNNNWSANPPWGGNWQ